MSDAISSRRFETMYQQAVPPWDIGRPQEVFVTLADAGKIRGSVLDAGCGTGENALFLAGRGFQVIGVDAAPAAVGQARAKAKDRAIPAEFVVGDALDLGALGRTFDTVIDSGVFHVFSDEDRPRYAQSLAAALVPGGRYFMLVFSDEQPGETGPRRISQREIRETFAEGWTVDEIVPALFSTNFEAGPARAWLASLTRI